MPTTNTREPQNCYYTEAPGLFLLLLRTNGPSVALEPVLKPLPEGPGVEHGLGGGERLADDHHQRLGWAQTASSTGHVDGVHVGQEPDTPHSHVCQRRVKLCMYGLWPMAYVHTRLLVDI